MQSIKILFLLLFSVGQLVSPPLLFSQNNGSLISGPWAGNIELKNATIWLEVDPSVKNISVKYYPVSKKTLTKTVVYKGQLGNDFNPVKLNLNGLDFNTIYRYTVSINGKESTGEKEFTTKDLWQHRKPAPDFSFLTGSCSYFNEPMVDRPGKPYGGDFSIFEVMGNTKADFHLWLGDNWYLREVDFWSEWGIKYRASRDRRMPVLQKLFSSMPQYAIWDDHDYGPNDAGKSYELKELSRKTFMDYWLNPSYGQDGEGIYTKVSYSDVDMFLTDDRYFRSNDKMKDSIDGKPNLEKTYFGYKQMDWLKNALLFSNSTFKIIVSGSQVINPLSDFDCIRSYPREYNELINFITDQKISGVIFLSGDRHHSEVIKVDRKESYPLYDVTVSPYTSGVSKPRGKELDHPNRIRGTLVTEQNFAKVFVAGPVDDRMIRFEFIGIKGNKLAEWSVSQKELK